MFIATILFHIAQKQHTYRKDILLNESQNKLVNKIIVKEKMHITNEVAFHVVALMSYKF